MNKVLILSHVINEQTPLYGGEKSITIKKVKSIRKGDSCNSMLWSFSNHIGTHIDAPLHFIKGGKAIADFKPKDYFFSKVFLLRLTAKPGQIIAFKDASYLKDCDLLLIKTGFESRRKREVYWKNSPGLHPEARSFLINNCPSLRAVGVDFISISNLRHRDLGRLAHKNFLSKNILLIEDMHLSALSKAPDQVIVSPLLVDRADAAPCTVYGLFS